MPVNVAVCEEEGEDYIEEVDDMSSPQVYSFGYEPITCHAFNKDRSSMYHTINILSKSVFIYYMLSIILNDVTVNLSLMF